MIGSSVTGGACHIYALLDYGLTMKENNAMLILFICFKGEQEFCVYKTKYRKSTFD